MAHQVCDRSVGSPGVVLDLVVENEEFVFHNVTSDVLSQKDLLGGGTQEGEGEDDVGECHFTVAKSLDFPFFQAGGVDGCVQLRDDEVGYFFKVAVAAAVEAPLGVAGNVGTQLVEHKHIGATESVGEHTDVFAVVVTNPKLNGKSSEKLEVYFSRTNQPHVRSIGIGGQKCWILGHVGWKFKVGRTHGSGPFLSAKESALCTEVISLKNIKK